MQMSWLNYLDEKCSILNVITSLVLLDCKNKSKYVLLSYWLPFKMSFLHSGMIRVARLLKLMLKTSFVFIYLTISQISNANIFFTVRYLWGNTTKAAIFQCRPKQCFRSCCLFVFVLRMVHLLDFLVWCISQ